MIIYDLTSLQSQKTAPAHGGGKFAEIVFNRLLERDIEIYAFYDSNRNIKECILDKIKSNNIKLFDINDITIADIVKQVEHPLIFSILPQISFLVTKTIGTIHDCRESCIPCDFMRFYLNFHFGDIKEYFFQKFFPGFLRNRRINRHLQLIKNPNFIPTTITQFTKYTLFNLYKDDTMLDIPIFMTPSYYKPYRDVSALKDEKFVLMVSANRWIKNPVRAIKAMDELFDIPQLKEYKFVVVGLGSSKEVKINIRNIENFIFKNYVSEEELEELYKNCTCLLFPSLYEGFGMPPLEAMCYGKPVVASSLSAIPEVCREGALYIDPFSIDDIKCKLSCLLLDHAQYEVYSRASLQRFICIYKEQEKDLDDYIDYVLKIDYESYCAETGK